MSRINTPAPRTFRVEAPYGLISTIRIKWASGNRADGDYGNFFLISFDGRPAVHGYVDEDGVIDEYSLTFGRETDRGLLKYLFK